MHACTKSVTFFLCVNCKYALLSRDHINIISCYYYRALDLCASTTSVTHNGHIWPLCGHYVQMDGRKSRPWQHGSNTTKKPTKRPRNASLRPSCRSGSPFNVLDKFQTRRLLFYTSTARSQTHVYATRSWSINIRDSATKEYKRDKATPPKVNKGFHATIPPLTPNYVSRLPCMQI